MGVYCRFLGVLLVPLFLTEHQASANGSFVIPPFVATANMHHDIIRTSDPTALRCLKYKGEQWHQVWDKRVKTELNKKMYVFNMQFEDQAPVPIVLSKEFKSVNIAETVAIHVAEAFGRIPFFMRLDVGRVAIHPGSAGFHGGGYTDEKGQIVLYKNTIDTRIKQKHLEESLFHEAVHASWDRKVLPSSVWKSVQKADAMFITRYAGDNPGREDLAETALLAFGDYNNRLPSDVSHTLQSLVPNKNKFIQDYIKHAGKSVVAEQQADTHCE